MTQTQSATQEPVETAETDGSSELDGTHRNVSGVLEERARRTRRRLERLIGIAATEGNALVPLRNGDEIFGAMLEAIRSARHTVDMMTFVYWKGEIAQQFADTLAARAREGVRVRVISGRGSDQRERRGASP